MNRGTILIYDGFVSARYLSGSLQGDGSVELIRSQASRTRSRRTTIRRSRSGRPSDDQFGEVTGYAANPGSHATMVFDTANNIGRFYGVLERPKFKICENQQQITPQAIRLSPEVQSELAQIAQSGGGKDDRQSGDWNGSSTWRSRATAFGCTSATPIPRPWQLARDDERHGLARVRFLLSPDGYVIASGKSAVATLTGGSKVFWKSCRLISRSKGYPWLIGVVSTAAGSANTLADVWGDGEAKHGLSAVTGWFYGNGDLC